MTNERRSIDRSIPIQIDRSIGNGWLQSWKVVPSKRRRLFWAGWMHFHFVCHWRLQFLLRAVSSKPRTAAPDLSQSSRVCPRLMRCSCLPHRDKFIC